MFAPLGFGRDFFVSELTMFLFWISATLAHTSGSRKKHLPIFVSFISLSVGGTMLIFTKSSPLVVTCFPALDGVSINVSKDSER